MRFQNLCALNLSMLAKRARKIIANPHSLVTQVLKAKYFLHSDFSEARIVIIRVLLEEAYELHMFY